MKLRMPKFNALFSYLRVEIAKLSTNKAIFAWLNFIKQ